MSFNKRNKKRERWIGKERETLLTAVQTNLQPRTMLLSKMVKSPRDSGYFDCSFSTNLVIVIKSVLFASAAWSIFPLLFFSLFSPCLSLNTLVLGSRSNSEHIYIYLKWGQRKRYARKESEWMGAEEMRWDEMRWDDGAISYSYLLSTEVSEDTWRAWSEGSERVVITAMRITSFVVFFSWSSLFVLLFPSCNVYLDTPLVTRPSLGRGQLRALRGNLYHTRPDAFFFVRGRSEFLRFSYPSTSNFTDNFSWISI